MVFGILLACVIFGILFICVFLIGGLYTRHLIDDAREQMRHDQLREEYFRLAGAKRLSDPRPYVPPVIKPRRTILPHMDKLDRMMRAGKRGTIIWRAGDRKSADPTTSQPMVYAQPRNEWAHDASIAQYGGEKQ